MHNFSSQLMKELVFKLFRFCKYNMDLDIAVEAREKVRNPTIKLNKKLSIAIAVTFIF